MTRARAAGAALLVAGTMTWLTVGAAFVIVLVSRQVRGDILYCGDRPAGSSNYGEASWQWWYPGTRCTFDAYGSSPASVAEPSATSALLGTGRRYPSDEPTADEQLTN